jgi:hypothetical protein
MIARCRSSIGASGAVIALARAVRADLVLMDDRDGVTVARQQGLAATGTLGVLDLVARREPVDLAAAFELPKATSFITSKGCSTPCWRSIARRMNEWTGHAQMIMPPYSAEAATVPGADCWWNTSAGRTPA